MDEVEKRRMHKVKWFEDCLPYLNNHSKNSQILRGIIFKNSACTVDGLWGLTQAKMVNFKFFFSISLKLAHNDVNFAITGKKAYYQN